jgi:hypothetical protein
LFDFLTPHSQSSAIAFGELIAKYLSEETSYEKVGWTTSDEEGKGHRNKVFNAINQMCKNGEWITSFVEREHQKSGESLWRRKEPEPDEECPNAPKARIAGKRTALKQLRAALEKYMRIGDLTMEIVIGELHGASMLLATPFSLLTQAKAPKMSAPKMMR